MKTTAKKLILTALTLTTVVFAVDTSLAAAAGSDLGVVSAVYPFDRMEAEDPAFWDKFRDAVTKDKPEPAEPPKVADRKPAEPPKEAPAPKPIERHAVAVAMSINNSKKPLPHQQNNPSPPYQPVQPPYQTPAPPYNTGSTPPPRAK